MFVEDKLEYDIMFQNKYLTIAPQLNYSQEDLRRSDFDEDNYLDRGYTPFKDKANKFQRIGLTFNDVNDEHAIVFEKIKNVEQKEILTIYSCYEILKDLSIRT